MHSLLRHSVTAALFAAVCCSAAFASEQTRAVMRSIYEALGEAYVLSLDTEQFAQQAQREKVLSALITIAANSEQLSAHGERVGLDDSYRFRAGALNRDAKESLLRFQQGHYEGASFLLHRLTENCASCHSRLPEDKSFEAKGPLLEGDHVRALSPRAQARLYVATRQFDDALETYESILGSPANARNAPLLMETFEGYFKITLRVTGDYDRSIATLESIRRRGDLSPYMRDYVTGWIGSLKELRERNPARDDLTSARAIIHRARERNLFPADRQGLVDFIGAAGILMRYLANDPPRSEQSEAYYLLGVAEANTSLSYWASEAEYFLETAVYVDASSTHARAAYDFLCAYVEAGYSGSGGTMVPAEVRARLDELRDQLPPR